MTDGKTLTPPEGAIAEQRANAIYERIAALKVDNPESYVLMADLVKEVKKVVNKFEDETRPAIDQANKLHKALIAQRDKWSDKFAEAESLGKEKLKHFYMSAEAPPVDGISFADVWDGDVTDAAQIPREFLIPDVKKLKDITKALKEATSIPGWKAKNGKTISVRS